MDRSIAINAGEIENSLKISLGELQCLSLPPEPRVRLLVSEGELLHRVKRAISS